MLNISLKLILVLIFSGMGTSCKEREQDSVLKEDTANSEAKPQSGFEQSPTYKDAYVCAFNSRFPYDLVGAPIVKWGDRMVQFKSRVTEKPLGFFKEFSERVVLFAPEAAYELTLSEIKVAAMRDNVPLAFMTSLGDTNEITDLSVTENLNLNYVKIEPARVGDRDEYKFPAVPIKARLVKDSVPVLFSNLYSIFNNTVTHLQEV